MLGYPDQDKDRKGVRREASARGHQAWRKTSDLFQAFQEIGTGFVMQ